MKNIDCEKCPHTGYCPDKGTPSACKDEKVLDKKIKWNELEINHGNGVISVINLLNKCQCNKVVNCMIYKQLHIKEQENIALQKQADKLKEKVQAYKEDRFCQGGCAVYQFDKIKELQSEKQLLFESLENIAKEIIITTPRSGNVVAYSIPNAQKVYEILLELDTKQIKESVSGNEYNLL
jgi:hypothetical protein